MTKIRRWLASLLVVLMMITMVPAGQLSAFAAFGDTTAKINVSKGSALPGSQVQVTVSVEDNPGILLATLTLTYDPLLTLVDMEQGEAWDVLDMTKPGAYQSPCNIVWDRLEDLTEDDVKDGVILTLTFAVSEEAQPGDSLAVNVSYEDGDVRNGDFENVSLTISNGSLSVIDYVPGDVNEDGKINGTDVVLLRRYIAGGYNVTINEIAGDVNADYRLNGVDVVWLRRYIAGGYDIEFLIRCEHQMEETEATEATCTGEGNIAYWHCTVCDRYFKDAEGVVEVSLANTVVPAKGHTVVIDPAVAPTYESTGLTEGSHCSVCDTVIVAQEVVSKLQREQYSITYDIANGDAYLATLNIENPNPTYYTSEDGLTLKNPSVPGYTFLGWYDLPSSNNAEIIKKIAAGEKEEYHLYAHWEKIEYEVSFEFPTQYIGELVATDNVKYTVDKGATLPVPTLEGYIFAGWSDDDGNIVKSILPGTIGNKQYMANWVSKRNQAWTKKDLDDPIIIEDEDDNRILFTYEIGEIRNVPAYVIEDFGYINSNGISKTVTKTFSTTVSDSLMKSYTNTVANSTVNSYGWTLSNSWSDSTTVNEEWCKQQGVTKEEAESYSKSDTSGWYVSSGSSGSTTTETLDTKDSYDLKTNTANSSTGGSSSQSNTHAASLSNSVTVDANLEVEVGAEVAGAKAGVKGSLGVSDTFSGSSSDSNTNSSSHNYSFSGGESNQGGSISHTGTNTTSNSSWNSESGYNGSSTVSSSSMISTAISESISNKYGYGKSYVSSSGESSTQGLTATDSSSDTYGSSVTYSTVTSESQTVSFTTTNTISGYHRWIMVDTAHVFAVVGYDIATSSYFVSTYTVMEDNLKPYEDYSCSSGNYDDNQNSFIGFEVPYDVVNYVTNRVGASEGLEVNASGVITAYTGTDKYVVIPEYMVIDNQDDTTQVIKVTGISENAFRGNKEIIGVNMSTFIDDIPDNAFEGCSSLTEVQSCAKTIGSNAFAGCTSMKAVKLGYGIDSIGENAFDSVDDITVYAGNEDVVDATIKSGAKHITLYVTDKCESLDNRILELTNTTEDFTFNGMGRTYTDLYIISDAGKTVINRADFVSTGATPLKISSDDVELNQVTVTSPGISLMLTSDTCNLRLYGETTLTANSENAVLCKNLVLSQIKNDYFSQLNISGNLLICGDIENEKYLNVTNGEIIKITDEDFEKYVKGTIIASFDANGGSVSTTTKTVYYGQKYGDLPTPERQYYTFDGWFTAKDGGTKITADTNVNIVTNITLYAHWTLNSFEVTFNANGGSCSTSTLRGYCGKALGTLPTPTRDYYTFNGWYTSESDGTQVSSSTVLTSAQNITVYAHWTQNSVLGWVEASAMPSGAQVVDTKWSYTLREYTTNSSASLSGWTKYDTKRTGWGATQGPLDYDPSNGSRNVWTGSTYDHTEYHYYRWTNSNHSALYTYSTSSYNCTILEEEWFNYQLPLSSKGTPIYYNGTDNWANRWVAANYAGNYSTDTTFTRDVNRTIWYYQDPIYTYYYYRDLSKESTSDPTGQSNVSNVVKWVKYRAK